MSLKDLSGITIDATLEKENPETRQTFPGLFLYAWTDAHYTTKQFADKANQR